MELQLGIFGSLRAHKQAGKQTQHKYVRDFCRRVELSFIYLFIYLFKSYFPCFALVLRANAMRVFTCVTFDKIGLRLF